MDAADSIAARGYTICDDLIHGFGGGYLPPVPRTRQTSARPAPAFTLEENMTMVIQPNIVTADHSMGVQVGELVRVTQSGVEYMHAVPRRVPRCA